MPRPSNTEKRREQIVEGLLAVMAEEGYAKATIAAIAKAAGLAPGLIHYHFENKREVLIALVERMTAGLAHRIEKQLERAGPDATALERLHAFIDAHVARGRDADPRAVAAWVIIAAEAVRQPEVQSLYAAAVEKDHARLESLVAAALAESRRDPRSASPIAAALLSAIEGAYHLAAAAPRTLPRGFASPTLRQAATSLITSSPRK